MGLFLTKAYKEDAALVLLLNLANFLTVKQGDRD
jgi:hypothetical protein